VKSQAAVGDDGSHELMESSAELGDPIRGLANQSGIPVETEGQGCGNRVERVLTFVQK